MFVYLAQDLLLIKCCFSPTSYIAVYLYQKTTTTSYIDEYLPTELLKSLKFLVRKRGDVVDWVLVVFKYLQHKWTMSNCPCSGFLGGDDGKFDSYGVCGGGFMDNMVSWAWWRLLTIWWLFTIWHLSPSRCSSDTCCDFPPLLAAFPAKPDHDSSEES